MSPAAALLTAAGALTLAGAGTRLSWPVTRFTWWADVPLHAFGSAAILLGTLIWTRTALPRVGRLIVAVGVTYHLGDLRAATHPAVFAAGFCLAYLWVAVVAHLALAWPDGRAGGRVSRLLVPLSYASAVGTQVVRYVADRPHGPMGLDVFGRPTAAARLGSVVVILMGSVIIAVVAHRWWHANALRRRPGAPFWAAVVCASVSALSAGVASALGAPPAVQAGFAVGSVLLGLFLVPVVYLVQLVRDAETQTGVATVALGLERGIGVRAGPERLRRALADALGDPALTLFLPPADPPPPAPGRARTPVLRGTRLLCLIDHDEALLQQPAIAAAATAAAALALERHRLNERLRRQLDEIGRSRRRVAEAAVQERRRIQQDLHDLAQQQLIAVRARIDSARWQLAGTDGPRDGVTDTLSRAHTELGDAIDALRRLIQRIYPVALTEHGLAAAVAELTDTAPLAVRARIPDVRWSATLESTAYFIVAEALANVYKHAGAREVTVTVRERDGHLVIEVTDDGVGIGTSPAPVLRSLQDRVDAAGGSLRVVPAEPGGTRIVAELPEEAP